MNLSCDVIRDLIPLVKDKVASGESEMLVLQHIQECENCRIEYEAETEVSSLAQNQIDDRKIIASIKKSIYILGITILVAGTLLGVLICNSAGIFYNFIIMPVIGGMGYLILKNKWFIAPLGVFSFSYLWFIVKYASESGINIDTIMAPFSMGIVFATLVLLGVAIAKLLKYAFGKEV